MAASSCLKKSGFIESSTQPIPGVSNQFLTTVLLENTVSSYSTAGEGNCSVTHASGYLPNSL